MAVFDPFWAFFRHSRQNFSMAPTSNMVAGPIWSSIGVTIRLSSVSSREFELPALSELTKEPGLMGEPEVMDLPPRSDLKS